MDPYWKDVLEIIKSAGTGVTAVSVGVAAYAIWRNWRMGVLQRTSTLLAELATEDEEDRVALWKEFPRRWQYKELGEEEKPMTPEEARVLFEIGRRVDKYEDPDYRKWNVARRHLNELARFAFAYVHRL